MIKFFRSFRKRLLTENKFNKYLLYAVGEIILVVIGILIALQINNLNEQRKQNVLEQDYLVALKKEYENNLVEVMRVIDLNSDLFKNARELADYTGPGEPNITEEKFAQLYFNTINSEVQYRPGSGVTTEIISSGKLSIFQNKELKNALATLDGLLLKIRFQEDEELAPSRIKLMETAYYSFSMRKITFNASGGLFGLDEGRFLDSNLSILRSKEFDNYLTAFILTSGYLNTRYLELKEQLQKIIDIIDSQIK